MRGTCAKNCYQIPKSQSGKMPNNNKYMSFDRHFNISFDLTSIRIDPERFSFNFANIIYMEDVPNPSYTKRCSETTNKIVCIKLRPVFRLQYP